MQTQNTYKVYDCDICRRDFPDLHATRQHKDALGHWVCYGCGDWLDTEDDLEEHTDDHFNPGPQYGCEACDATFPSPQEARYHMDALKHWRTYWCSVCEKGFQNGNNFAIHMNSTTHKKKCKRFKCEACPARFASLQQARYHMEVMNHWRIHYCDSCARGFKNENNLRMHLNSRTHRGSNMICPFCGHSFTTATGLTHHIETGSCPNARDLNRETLLEQIRRRDPDHIITKKVITHDSSPPIITIVSPDCWNGYGYECYICNRVFSTLKGLELHVNSSVHVQKVYHCPGHGCFREFTTLAGLFNHLESESCGATSFEDVQSKMGDIIMGRRAITLG